VPFIVADEVLRERVPWPSRFPRSARYDARWQFDNAMGPNPLWLLESLADVMPLEVGSRVLDLGCGKAITSVFLAKEYGVTVWAADLWIEPTENLVRLREAGVDDRVFPLKVEAHAIPFAEGFFDAIVSIDAYHYFGTDDLYLSYLARFVKPGGRIGIVVPGLVDEVDAIPEHLRECWEPDYYSFHSPAWWARHWRRGGVVDVVSADLVPDGWEAWLRWDELGARFLTGWRRDVCERFVTALRRDAGATLGFTRVVATRRS
jgi:cyclopropane fatty-acyl-phospholipid synthase-like methyltransferase